MAKRVLVTGGAGFIGSHLCERLIGAGHEVVCVDDFSTGKKSNVEHLLDCRAFALHRHDVCDVHQGKPFEVDEVFSLACPASPRHYQADPVRTLRICAEGTRNALELARQVRAKVVIASTSEVYGDPLVHPQSESYAGNVHPVAARACYAEGKRYAETLAVSYARQHGVEVRIARIFNTYGPRLCENEGGVVANFVGQCLRDRPVTVFGDGGQTRSLCYVDDMIDGLMRLSSADEPMPVNLGNPLESTMLELAQTVRALVGSQSAIVHEPLPEGDPVRRQPDITRAIERLGWRPTTPLHEGLARTIADFRRRMTAE